MTIDLRSNTFYFSIPFVTDGYRLEPYQTFKVIEVHGENVLCSKLGTKKDETFLIPIITLQIATIY